MPFDITVTREFSASHQLLLNDGSLEPLHGHNWRVRVTVSSSELDSIGTVMDFHELERLLDAIIQLLHNGHLNDALPFSAGLNPSAENVAFHIGSALRMSTGVRLHQVEVWETTHCSAVFRP